MAASTTPASPRPPWRLLSRPPARKPPGAGLTRFALLVTGTWLRWDNHDVEIALTDKNAVDLHEVPQPYLAVGRPVSSSAASRPQRRQQASRGNDGRRDRQAVRAWARAHGHQVSDRGQIPQRILQAYDAAQ